MNAGGRPHILAIGGTAREKSSTEQALALALESAQQVGASVRMLGGEFLVRLPHYLTRHLDESGSELIAAVRAADGLIIASPGYHGSISGLVKNAIDYLEETSKDARVYLDGLPVGLIATAHGRQASTNTLAALRSIVHSLRGWPTPLGATINSAGGIFVNGRCIEPTAREQLELVGVQVYEFARVRLAKPAVTLAAAPISSAVDHGTETS